MSKGSPRKGSSFGRTLALILLGFALGSAATYLVISAGSGTAGGPPESRAAGLQPELLDPVREALRTHGVALSPGLPPGLDAPPDRLSRQLTGNVAAGDLPVWWGRLPARSSLLRLNGDLTRALEEQGGEVLAAWEETDAGRGRDASDRSPVPIPYRTRIPGAGAGATLWLGVGHEGEPGFLLCLQKDGGSRS